MAQIPDAERPRTGKSRSEPGKKTLVKKSYVSPRILEYGSVAKLTQSGAATVVDGFGMMACL